MSTTACVACIGRKAGSHGRRTLLGTKASPRGRSGSSRKGNRRIGCGNQRTGSDTRWLCLYAGDGKTSSRIELTLSVAWGGMSKGSQISRVGSSEAVQVCGLPPSEVQLVQLEVASDSDALTEKSRGARGRGLSGALGLVVAVATAFE
mmetsp:Transcript_97573/g.281552  ORF Transcript_97573/g.281552 Transcript_97573/m.281552 type:complete len:148 (+) Transcript_97573:991-1434(+)